MEQTPRYAGLRDAARALYDAHTTNRVRFNAMRRMVGYRTAVVTVLTNPYWGG